MNHRILVRKIMTEMVNEKNLRLYGFDWDDNILRMPTKINMEMKKNGKWVPVKVSTEDFAHLRTDPKYRTTPNSFADFTHPEKFLEDTEMAIENNRKSPSFRKFKENLIHANPFSIITARGHNPQVIKKGVKLFIEMVLSPDEKETMVDNIKEMFRHEELFSKNFLQKLDSLNDEQIIDIYLDERGDYYPVSSKEFGQRFGLETSGGASNPEHAKKVALLDFISKYNDLISSGKYVNTSLGFSDDDPRNVKAMVEYVKNELSRMYPEVKFIIYDTSEGGYNKVHIEANKENNNNEVMLEHLVNRIVSKIKSK